MILIPILASCNCDASLAVRLPPILSRFAVLQGIDGLSGEQTSWDVEPELAPGGTWADGAASPCHAWVAAVRSAMALSAEIE